ncbi:MAG: GIY-YIG nuclease family protein [Candidatus Gracilibacteria bacterium]|nr:GIY-YIG nuclease family protein [Candidatus Gracilibacteria bacterium]
MKNSFVYIIGNHNNSIFYIGVTSNLIKRVQEHKNKLISGFSSKYNLNKLLYYEIYDDINIAINREKQLKNWHKIWKINLIKIQNPELKDLFSGLL